MSGWLLPRWEAQKYHEQCSQDWLIFRDTDHWGQWNWLLPILWSGCGSAPVYVYEVLRRHSCLRATLHDFQNRRRPHARGEDEHHFQWLCLVPAYRAVSEHP